MNARAVLIGVVAAALIAPMGAVTVSAAESPHPSRVHAQADEPATDDEPPLFGSPGLVARIAAGGNQALQVWDVAKSWRTAGPGKRPTYDPGLESAWTTLEAKTVSHADFAADDWFGSTAIRSTPQWSPDGTKIAYVATTDYPGTAYKIVGAQPYPPYLITKMIRRTTAVFVYDLISKRSTQVSFPIEGLAYCGGRWSEVCGAKSDPETGHMFYDTNPFWVEDGESIAFVRFGGQPRTMTSGARSGPMCGRCPCRAARESSSPL